MIPSKAALYGSVILFFLLDFYSDAIYSMPKAKFAPEKLD